MSPGSAIAAACFALISLWRFSDGEYVWAAVFAALALANLAFSMRKASSTTGGSRGFRSRTAAARLTEDEVRTRRNWRIIAGAGLALTIAAMFWFPPLALVMSALTVYSALQLRKFRTAAA
ncbi:hypothetical protein [Arthrobacter sp.]|uniref:hypothetical protein n=1 Tax=Arthrobacter sp. TaxID=1667 RepID=UPI002810EF9D|nr:hypothetical protein [Arthrobacter sp.]